MTGFDDGWVINARAQGGRQGLGFSGGVSYQDHSLRQSGSSDKLAATAYKSKAADLKLVMESGERSSLMLTAQVMEQPSTPRYDELAPGFGQTKSSSEQYLFKPNRRSFLHARFRYDGQSNWFDQVEANLARQVITDDRLSQDYGSPEIVTETNSSTLDGLTLQVNSSFDSGISLVWGTEYYTDAVDSNRFTQVEESETKTEVRGRFPDKSSMDSTAVYFSGDWINADKFNLAAGLRYSWFDINLPAGDVLPGVSLKPSALTGDIHAVYELSPRPGNRFSIPNTNLDPETVWSYDLGIKTGSDSLELEVFAFYLDYSDKITSVFTGELSEDGLSCAAKTATMLKFTVWRRVCTGPPWTT